MVLLRIAVVGAGIVGLSTAVQIQSSLPSAQVTIIADKFDVDTTSDGAAGTFQPASNLVPGIPREILKQWSVDSFKYYSEIARSPDADEAGVSIISGYQFFINDPKDEDPLSAEICFHHHECTSEEMKMFPGLEKAYQGFFYSTLMVEGRWFLPWLMKRFKNNGGVVEVKKLSSLEELVGRFDLVANCTGLGSSQLLGDKALVPVRGQVIRVKAPWIKHFFMIDGYDSYILPGKETVVVGGTRQSGDVDLNVRAADRDSIWQKACMHMPSLKAAKWEWEWVGLRPFRKPLRLEKEILTFGRKTLQVVHNYGHGGNGIALAWGTAKHACRLVCECASMATPSNL